MKNPHLKALAKLDRPPSAANWVRFVLESPEACARAILRWALGQPPFTYQPAQIGIKDRIELGIDRAAALRICATKGAPAGRKHNTSLVNAFFDYDEHRNFGATNPVQFDKGMFRVSRELLVPVAPLSVVRERGFFLPIFLCGWNELKLNRFQRRLLMTLNEDAFLSLTDFQNSPAEMLFFPSQMADGIASRHVEIWRRGDYDLLSPAELSEAAQIFMEGRKIAAAILREKASSWSAEQEKPRESGGSLFD